MKKVEIFDPAMCCSTGVCGPVVDPELTRIASAVYSLEKRGFTIKRYNLTSDPGAFVENGTVNQALAEKGPEALPVVLVDGEIVKMAEYPTNEELAKWFGTTPAELQEKPRLRVSVNFGN
ncbi:arsenite efflux transporter metallochaperone ArsD [Planococcus sp. FY231025]|uniref:arsenite efflux transporter metallochaperone ArsD n=1 Tax=Planococcus sp. FY231025 TaxID=3455699 RepID=UPI003F939DD8